MSAPRIVIMAALKQEALPLSRGLAGLEERIKLVQCGVGPHRAEATAKKELPGASLLISTGCCGGLVPGARSGLLLIPRRVMAAVGDSFPDAPAPDEQWGELARHLAELRGFHCSDRPLISVSEALTSARSKAECHQRTGAVGVDMESAALAHAAAAAGVPHLVVRHVLDAVDEPLPERPVSDARGKIKPLRLVRAMTKPKDFLGRGKMLVRLRANAAAAAPLIRAIVEEAG